MKQPETNDGYERGFKRSVSGVLTRIEQLGDGLNDASSLTQFDAAKDTESKRRLTMKRKSKATKCSMCNAKSQMRNGRRVAIGVVGLCDDCRIVKPTKRRLLSLDEILDGLAAGK